MLNPATWRYYEHWEVNRLYPTHGAMYSNGTHLRSQTDSRSQVSKDSLGRLCSHPAQTSGLPAVPALAVFALNVR